MSRWDDAYRAGTMPWEIGEPEPLLVRAVEDALLPTGRLLEIGCGTGTNARYLAERGWDVTAVDLSPTAIEMARQADDGVRYDVHDVLAEPLAGGPYDAAFDRGCFHTFDDPEARATFAARVAEALRVGGRWLTLAGSTEGPPREHGPPRRSLRELAHAIEPVLEIVEVRSLAFRAHEAACWLCIAQRRGGPAQPSTRRKT